MGRNSTKYQYYTAIFVNISTLIYGITCGWPSPTFPILKSDNTPIPSGALSSQNLSWVASIMCLGGLTGTILCGYVVDRIGRKISLLLLAIPNLHCYILILLAQDFYYLLIARFMGGLAGGGAFILVPLYIAEISEDGIRGSLSSKLVFSCNIGILLAFIIGNNCSYTIAAIIYVCLPFVYFISIIKLPETPFYLIKKNKFDEAKKSLAFFRNVRDRNLKDNEYLTELELLKNQNDSKGNIIDESVRITYKDFVTRPALKAMGIGIGLLVLNQGCGCFAMLNYTATIFIEGGSNIFCEFCLSISAFGTCIGLVVMGSYQYLKILDYDLTQFSWIPVASFSFTIFIASWGVLTLPFVVLAEIMPEKIRATAVSIAMTILRILAFSSIKYIYQLFEEFGMHGASFIFAGISLFGALFVIFCVPETKGKSFDEIQQLL